MCPYRRLISYFPSTAPFIRECVQNALVTLSSWCLLCSAQTPLLSLSLFCCSLSLFLPPSCFGVGYNLKAPYMPACRLVAFPSNRKGSSRLSFRRVGSVQETALDPEHNRPPLLVSPSVSSSISFPLFHQFIINCLWQSEQLTYPLPAAHIHPIHPPACSLSFPTPCDTGLVKGITFHPIPEFQLHICAQDCSCCS